MEQTDGQDRIESLDTDPVTNSSQLTLEKEQRQQNEVLGGGGLLDKCARTTGYPRTKQLLIRKNLDTALTPSTKFSAKWITDIHKNAILWASLVAQWLRICLPMQGTRVQALVWEDPTCRRATRPVSHNY